MFTPFNNWIIFPNDKHKFNYFAGDHVLGPEELKKNCFGYIKYPKALNESWDSNFFSIQDKGCFASDFFLSYDTKTVVGNFKFPEKKKYIESIEKIIEHIKLGDIYEMNFCFQIKAETSSFNPFDIFFRLHKITAAPHSCLAKFGSTYILCSSPERFLKREGDKIITQPIKGTARRGSSLLEDEELKKELMNSHKEKSEHVMAVDVSRNDLSRIASRGTVAVDELFGVYTFKQVHQMISTVSCKQVENISFDEIINATFPMASMTGAPKIRAMQLINEFENSQRDFYSGSIGKIEENGDFDFNVVIRSIIYDSETKEVSIGVGSAITNLSNPEKEWEECMVKLKGLMAVLE
ncbi:MAG: anthranilate synthase component I family protein [Bacteroidota bacterium]